jgi:hypothetical protein
VLNDQIVEPLGIPKHWIDRVAAREQQELARRERLALVTGRKPRVSTKKGATPGTRSPDGVSWLKGDKSGEELSMVLIGSFVVLLVIGEGVNVAIALLVERFSETASLAVFFAFVAGGDRHGLEARRAADPAGPHTLAASHLKLPSRVGAANPCRSPMRSP